MLRKELFLNLLFNTSSELPIASCRRPNDDQPFVAYRTTNISGHLVRLDMSPQQVTFPKNTIIQYICVDNEHTNNANGIECRNGEWFTRLLPCGKCNMRYVLYFR